MSNDRPRILRMFAGVLMMLSLGSMYAWSYFKIELAVFHPDWSQAELTFTFTLMMSCFCLGGLAAGNLPQKISKPVQISVAAVLISGGLLGTAFLPEQDTSALIQLYLCYGVLTGLGTGIAYNAILSGIQPWFPDQLGLVSGCLLMCLGFGSLLLGNLGAYCAARWNIFLAFRVLSLLTFVVLLALAPTASKPRHAVSPQKATPQAAEGVKQYAPRELLRRGSFWLCFVWNICVAAGGMLVINSASAIAVNYGMIATVGLLVSVCNAFGRLLSGHCVDRIGWRKSLFLNNSFLLAGGALLLLSETGTLAVFALLGMLLVGLCYGGGVTMVVALMRKLYGDTHYSGNLALCDLSLFPSSVLGPMISAVLLDRSGTYHSTFCVVILFALCAFGITIPLRRA